MDRDLIRSPGFANRLDVSVSPDALLDLPEKAVQFGTGALLRGFVEYFVEHANRRGCFGGRVVLVGSTDSGRGNLLNQQDGLYTLSLQGLQNGVPQIDHQVISCVSRALSATDDWDAVLECARNPLLELVFSNTTEVGINLDEGDQPDPGPPRSFPGKLTRFLYERAATFGFAPDAGLAVLPCELIEGNGDRLREIVVALATQWDLGEPFARWIDSAVIFCNTLVDRIVTGSPVAAQADALAATLGYRDEMLTVCEPYALFAIEGDETLAARLPFGNQADVIVTRDITPFRERKVRLLNGTHTIAVPIALLCGCDTVRTALEHDVVGSFIRTVLFDELVPGVDVPGADAFARAVLERFGNPYINHSLLDITLQGTMKMRVRVIPSITSFAQRFGAVPQSLAFGFAAYIEFMRLRSPQCGTAAWAHAPADESTDRVLELLSARDGLSEPDVAQAVASVVSDTTLWGTDLSRIPGFADAVTGHLSRIREVGALNALESHLAGAELCP